MNPIALDALYRAQLESALAAERAPWHTTPWQTQAMLAWMATRAGGRLSPGQANRTWVWSDLHLDHAEVIPVFSRPFRTIWQMQTALLQAWLQTVDEADIIICLGDVTVGARRAALDEAPRGAAGNEDSGGRKPRHADGPVGACGRNDAVQAGFRCRARNDQSGLC